MLEDLRSAGCSARQLQLFTALFHAFPPPAQKQTGRKGECYAECITPKLLPLFKADISGISHLLAPDQAMVNEVSKQLAEGAACTPAYVPFVTANLADPPWKPQLSTHEKAGEDWNHRMHSLRSSQPLPFQSYLYYQIRFILAAHMAGAWSEFG